MSTIFTDDLMRHASKHYGKHRGRVVDNVDEHNQGTISVVVPSKFGPDTPVRARACMPYGHFYVPPVNTHVWIEFEEGDLGLPIWVGSWYPEGSAPPEAQVTPPDTRVIQTPAGHTIEIVDKEGEERILIRHGSDAFLSIDSKGTILMSNPKGSHVHLDAEGEKAALVEQHGNFLTMSDKGTSIVNPDGTTLNIAGDTVHVSAAKVVVEASTVALGAGASDPTIMGNAFKLLWEQMLAHVHPTPAGPSSPSLQLVPLIMVPGTHLTSSVMVK